MHSQIMSYTRRTLCLVFLVITGCAPHLPVTGALPGQAAITQVARVTAGTPFALDPSAKSIAFVSGGLRIKDLGEGREWEASSEEPTAVAWARDGKRLAASFAMGKETIVRLFDRQGALREEARVDGRVSGFAWLSSGDLLAFAVKQRTYSFGTNLAELLYRWDGKGEPAATTLYETTLRRGTLRQWEAVFRRTLTFTLSPLDDEILYGQVHDPPAFNPYLKLILRHLDNGREREVATVTPLSAGGVFFGTGERLLCGDGESESWLLDPWGKRKVTTIPSPGQSIALSTFGRYYLLDGRLYLDGTEIASFPAASVGEFSAQGGCLALRSGERLYLVAGLPEKSAVPPDPALAERLRQLRKWLSEGLITDKEYREARGRIAQ